MTHLFPSLDETFKILIVGAFGIGKTTLIGQISQVPIVGTEVQTSGNEADVKPTTTVGVEFGIFSAGDDESVITLLLFGTPGQDRFSEMRTVASMGVDGLIVIVNGNDPATWSVGKELHDDHNRSGLLPTLLVVNHWPEDDEPPPGLAAQWGLDPDLSAVVCGDVTNQLHARRFVVELLTLILSIEIDEEGEFV